MTDKTKEFIDEYKNVHLKAEELGRGGQGVVFRTKDPDLAIKLVTDKNGTPIENADDIKKYSQQLKRFRFLPLPENLNIAAPVALLKNNAGYVMQLLSEMIPFDSFWPNDKYIKIDVKEDIPKWLSEMPEDEAGKLVYYCKSGGLKRRLNVLYKTATLLAKLHGAGLVYGDISPNNIFVSESSDNSSVWLIDADNIRFELLSNGKSVYTPNYGAPELVQGTDCGRPASDCHAFAVVAFYMLSLLHPFIGQKVLDGDDEDWADQDLDADDNDNQTAEEKAYAGLFPWIDDINDDSNLNGGGLPRQLLLTKKLETLFQRTFSEGRTNSLQRPTIFHWPIAFAQAADKTIVCTECKMSWFYDIDGKICPYCDTPKPKFWLLESYHWTNKKEIDSPCWIFVNNFHSSTEKIKIPERVFSSFLMESSDDTIISLSFHKDYILISKSETCCFDIFVALPKENNGKFVKIINKIQIPISAIKTGFWLFSKNNETRIIKCSIKGV